MPLGREHDYLGDVSGGRIDSEGCAVTCEVLRKWVCSQYPDFMVSPRPLHPSILALFVTGSTQDLVSPPMQG